MEKNKLELNRKYLVNSIQLSYNRHRTSLTEIEVINESEQAFLIKIKNEKEYWILKKWRVDIIDKLN